ncbi:MAG: NAD-dependent deacylase [Myxococcales bacterium]|nr:NAD-dependent deacylase [Myxococcales bacterium]
MVDVRVRSFGSVVFFTGAGMSAESGVPTYRGKGGIWKEYDHESCACQTAFEREPEYVWEFHNYRRELVGKCEPNEGHLAIARAERARPAGIDVVTQNIDGLHQRAGSQRVHELHGSLWKLRCDACGWRDEDHRAPLPEIHCPECGAYKRPGIVWFGDNLDGTTVRTVMERMASCDLLVSIGTSAVVYPAAELPLIARRRGAVLVEVNPEETPLSEIYQVHMRCPATEALAELCEGLEAPG